MIYSCFVTGKEVSKLLNVSLKEINSLIADRELETIEFNNSEVRILIRSVIQYKMRQD